MPSGGPDRQRPRRLTNVRRRCHPGGGPTAGRRARVPCRASSSRRRWLSRVKPWTRWARASTERPRAVISSWRARRAPRSSTLQFSDPLPQGVRDVRDIIAFVDPLAEGLQEIARSVGGRPAAAGLAGQRGNRQTAVAVAGQPASSRSTAWSRAVWAAGVTLIGRAPRSTGACAACARSAGGLRSSGVY